MKRQNGFTLIELVIILFILGILFMISLPPITKFSDSIKLNSEAKMIASDLHFCWASALSEDITYEMVFEKETGKYMLRKPNIIDGNLIEVKAGKLPSRLFFEKSITIKFSSSGFALPGYSGTITIRSKSGGLKKVIVSSYGRIRIDQ